jgi:membrane protease YdiL (CAAX protease family)
MGLATVAFSLTFGGPPARFWQRMTRTGLVLGALALAADEDLRRPRLAARDVLQGVLSAGGLYVIFRVGDRLARRRLRQGAAEIDRIYALRSLRPPVELAARLGAIIGPAEELFWRGYLQRRLQRRFGRWRGAALAAGAYGGVHLAAHNFTLLVAASVAGVYWCALAALGMPMAALIVSHVVWDVWIFLVAPTQQPPRPSGDRPFQ